MQQLKLSDAKMSDIVDATIFFNSELIRYALKYYDKIRQKEVLAFNIFNTITDSFKQLFDPSLS